MLKLLDILRIALTAAGFFIGYLIGFQNGYDPFAQLHFMIPVVIVAIAGISGIEGLFFGEKAAGAKGYAYDGNYQRQSALAMISFAIMSIVICLTGWGPKAELTLYFTFLLFFSLSAVNHATDAIKRRNYRWQNINRPFITLLLIAGSLYPVLSALNRLY